MLKDGFVTRLGLDVFVACGGAEDYGTEPGTK
jgi:hypothetical protein